VYFLDAIGMAYGYSGPSQQQAQEVLQRLTCATTDQIFNIGLHEFVEDTDRRGQAINEQYLFAPIASPRLVKGHCRAQQPNTASLNPPFPIEYTFRKTAELRDKSHFSAVGNFLAKKPL
jgi:hypothetical protein